MAGTAFVTGGTGFVGVNLVERLVAAGWNVTALHRPTSDLTYLRRFPVELAEGSVTDRGSLLRAIPEGTEAVFHVAADVSFWSKNDARQNAINIDGTRCMVEAAAARGVHTFIHTSSTSAWGRVRGEVTEDTPLLGASSWINYERSKYLGELEALRGLERGMKVVLLNPAEIAGPYDTTSFGRLFFLLRDGALPGVSAGSVSVTHVHDVVQAHIAAVDRGRSGERYLLAGERYRFDEFVEEIARVSGKKAPRALPAWLFKVYGRLSAAVAAVTGKEPDVTPEIAEVMTDQGVTFRSDKAIRELGYRIQPMSVAVRDSYAWLVAEGLLAARS